MTSSSDPDPEPTLVLPQSVRETLHERATGDAPGEVCGVLLGERGESDEADASDPHSEDRHSTDRDRVSEAVAVSNVADSPESRYELDPGETLRTVEDAESAGDDVVGFYHSHPRGPIEPSTTDRERATWPGYVYCIVTPDDLAAYRWTGEAFRRLRVESS